MSSSIKMERKQRINDIFVEIKSKVDDGGGGSILLFYCPSVNHAGRLEMWQIFMGKSCWFLCENMVFMALIWFWVYICFKRYCSNGKQLYLWGAKIPQDNTVRLVLKLKYFENCNQCGEEMKIHKISFD